MQAKGSTPPLIRDPLQVVWAMTRMWHFGGPEGQAHVMAMTFRVLQAAQHLAHGEAVVL